MNDKDNILAIVRRYREDGSYLWSVRGIGNDYKRFYDWLYNYSISLKNVHDNFPWDYFEFVHKSDEDYMIRTFAEFIWKDQ